MTKDILEEILTTVDAMKVPTKYVIMCSVKYKDGSEKIVSGQDLEHFAESLDHRVEGIKFFFNLRRLRHDIVSDINSIYDEINRYISSRPVSFNILNEYGREDGPSDKDDD